MNLELSWSVWMLLLAIWLFAATMMTLGWWWQKRRNNAGIVDVLWAFGVGMSAVLLAALGDGAVLPRGLLAVLGGVWGLRLAWYLWRRVRGEEEDGRYRHLRAHWNGNQFYFFLFFQFQALLIVLFALPFVAVVKNPNASLALAVAAVAVWLLSVGGESIADQQLAHHRADPANRGKTCRSGLWKYSRHPNYFFEWTHWFAYVLLAVGSAYIGLAWAGPVVMFVFLRWISGIPYTEAQALRTRGEDYRDYQRRTSMLFPWFPKTD
jgi:steroid 5-alpha reductase family enzyme